MTDHSETLAVIQLFNRAETKAALKKIGAKLKKDMKLYKWPEGSREVLKVAYQERERQLTTA